MTNNNSSQTKDMLGRKPLTAVDEAQRLLLSHLEGYAIHPETLPLNECLDRVTAEDIFSPEDLPAYPRSTMDGFAVCAADTFGATESMPCYLQIAGEVIMGEKPTGQVERGSCFRIATGGLLPQGADAVVMFEHTVPVDDTMIEVVKSSGQGSNIIMKGDDIASGHMALPAGHLLRPQDLGLLAGLGITDIKVRRKAKIGILSTGDEIVSHSEAPQPGKIRNINTIALAAQAKRLGAEVYDFGIVSDNESSFFPVLKKAIDENDIVVFSGGSSVGTRDLGEKGIETLCSPGILVHGIALKPGKPILIGLHGHKTVFGLPGHPVSAMVCFDLFIKEVLQKITRMQTSAFDEYVEATLDRNLPSAPGRMDIIRVRLKAEQNTVIASPVLGKSGAISTLSKAHGYLIIDEHLQGLNKDTKVKVHLYK